MDSVSILLINIFAALATGGAVVAGQYLGKKREDKAAEAGNQLMLFILLLSVVITLLLYIGKGFVLNTLFGAIEPEVKRQANTYFIITALSIPFIGLYNGGAALFRTMGISKIPMFASIIMNFVNVVGNAILIYGMNLGVAGAAIPTLIARITAALIILVMLRNEGLAIHLSKPLSFTINKKIIKRILNIGVPNGLENSLFQLGKIVLLSLVASFGTASIAANAVANTISSFQMIPGSAMGFAVITVVSRCVGAGDYEQARYYTRKLMIITYAAALIMSLLLVAALPIIIKLYNLSEATALLTRKIIIYIAICTSIFWPVAFTLPNTLRAASDVRYSMLLSISSMWLWRIGLGFVLAKYLNMGVFGVWVSMSIDWVFRAAGFLYRYLGTKWEKIRI